MKDRILYLEKKIKNELLIEEKDKLYEEIQNNKAKIYNMLNKFKDEIEKYYNKLSKADDILDESNNRLNKLNDKIIKIKKVLDDKALSDDKRYKLQIEIKNLIRKLKEEEKNRKSIHNQNLITTSKLKELTKEKKDVKKLEEENEELYNLLDTLTKNFKERISHHGIHKDTKNEYNPNGFNKDGIHKNTNERY